MDPVSDPHAGQPVLTSGPALEKARAALVLLHGRGASAHSMLDLFHELQVDNLHAVAPQAAGNTWYPQSFLAPLENNQPYLDSALAKVAAVVHGLVASGIPRERIALLGFSQGACLSSEFVVRHPARYGAVMALTGGVIGPPGAVRHDSGSLDGTPVFLGTSDPDMHVPLLRVEETRDLMTRMGAQVELRSYRGMPHTVNEEELEICRQMLQRLTAEAS